MFWAMPSVRPWDPLNPKDKTHTSGHSPESNLAETAGHSHRREASPGGKAHPEIMTDPRR
jgi:hypothetical protein